MADWRNTLYFGDNLDILREYVPDESVDLIYLDPPFNSNATYNVLFKETSGEASAAQIQAFGDTWHWSIESEAAYREVVTFDPKHLADLLQAMRSFLGQNDMMAYVTMMAQRMTELHRVLKPTGSIYLHCDPTASHYLKLLMDAVFGARNFRSEITWKRTSAHNDRLFGSESDTLLYYGGSVQNSDAVRVPLDEKNLVSKYRYEDERGQYRTGDLTGAGTTEGESGAPWRGYDPGAIGRHWAVPRTGRYAQYLNETLLPGYTGVDSVHGRLDALNDAGMVHFSSKGGMPAIKRYLLPDAGQLPGNIWTDIYPVNAQAAERLGYPTQKPEALLERIIRASSNEGDLVLDPFCGCGTTVAVAEKLGRRWIGIDITHIAVSLMKYRLRDTFGSTLSDYDVVGVPQDIGSARALATQSGQEGRFQFEYWALGLVDARPGNNRRRGADAGVDGYINFFDDNSGKAKTVLVQVKSGHVQRNVIATLKGDMEREKAEMGLLVTLEPPTRPMEQEAAAAGFYVPEHFPDQGFPRVQIATIEDILNSNGPRVPRLGLADAPTFRRAPRRRRAEGEARRML